MKTIEITKKLKFNKIAKEFKLLKKSRFTLVGNISKFKTLFQVLPNSVKPASKNVKQTSAKEVKKGPTVSPANIIGTRDESLIDESIKQTLLKGLTAEDFIMETPSAAIFTLVVGKTF